jgi:uncharacterized membrane protein YbhN (UPF0104 family)
MPSRRWRKRLGPWVGAGVLGLALFSLFATLRHSNLHDIGAALLGLPAAALTAAALLTVLSYLILTLYDQIGFRIIARKLPWNKIALASFMGNVFGNSGTNATLTGAAVRFWIYSSLGVPALDVTRVVVFCNLGFWLGYFCLGAAVFGLDPLALPAVLPPPFTDVRVIGLLLAIMLGTYLLLVAMRRPVRVRQWHFSLPSPGMTAAQIAVAICDLLAMAATLWVLLPAMSALSFLHFLQVFLLALVAGGVSQVPGGLGVFETVFLLLLPPGAMSPQVLAALLAFRGIYYLAPLLLAGCLVLRRGALAQCRQWTRLARVRRRRLARSHRPAQIGIGGSGR